jgi:uncharacterized glyoxalase superfamily protein PhnB
MGNRIIPTFHYEDTAAAVEWLCEALGFERHRVMDDGKGTVVHAQLTFGGDAMIMLGTTGIPAFDAIQVPVSGATVTSSPYIIVEDADALYQRAVAAGAEVIIAINTTEYGGRNFTVRDPQGQVWNFGTFDPWARHV